MLFDWLAREGWIVANWWLIITLMGLTVLPLLMRLLPGLPDRGYTLARPAGLLLISFLFWFAGVLGFLQNTTGTILLAWLVVLIASLVAYFGVGGPINLRAWWRENRTVVIVGELLFVFLLVSWAVYRAYQNDLTTTEKPMDLAFMSAIQRDPSLPPNDPWLSGYSISYYYFGYLMASVMSTLAGVWSTIGYNMHLALLFALSGTGAFGVVYNLVRSRGLTRLAAPTDAAVYDHTTPAGQSRRGPLLAGLLAAFFLVMMGNWQTPLVEIPYWTGSASQSYLDVWDVNERRTPIAEAQASGDISDWSSWWWFRVSRSVSDRGIEGGHQEVIAEFPQFSFILGDSHPHVMALPFVMLAIGLAVNLLLSGYRPRAVQVVFYALCIGALIFLNTWDAPIYLAVLVGADALRRLGQRGRLILTDWVEMTLLGLALLLIGLLLYAPFLIGFRSQLGGVLPNIINPTQFPQLFLMFGPFMLLIGAFLAIEGWRAARENAMNWQLGVTVALGVPLVLLLLLVLLALLGTLVPALRNAAMDYVAAAGGWPNVFPTILERRAEGMATLIVLLIPLLLVVARLFPPVDAASSDDAHGVTYPPATGLALMLVGAALLLVLIPEFVYLRDNFGNRMNTIFKFYYQAWAALSIASAYGVYTIMTDARLPVPSVPVRAFVGAMLAVVIGLGALYPALGMYTRMYVDWASAPVRGQTISLDGGPGFVSLDDYNAAMCLLDRVGRQPDVVVAEADPTSSDRVNYNPAHGRVGSLTGIPVIVGWTGHQSQWRGEGYGAAVGTRPQDLRTLYTDPRIDQVIPIIEQYGIDYIMYGLTERLNHGPSGEDKFRENFEVICEYGESRVYRVGPPEDSIIAAEPVSAAE